MQCGIAMPNRVEVKIAVISQYEKYFCVGNLQGITLEEVIVKSADNILVTDSTGIICIVSQTMLEDLSLKAEEVLGQNVSELVRKGYYDRSTSLECIQKGQEVVGVVKTRDGHYVFSISRPIFDQHGRITYIITNTREQTVMTQLMEELETTRRAYRKYAHIATYLGNNQSRGQAPIAASDVMKRLLETCQSVACTDGTVLLQGESGTGKEVCAAYIYRNSLRSQKAFLPINCGAIPESLIESELFGYEKGAFTGADPKGRAGLLELADGGTAFLDEIGELPLDVQAKLLRFSETGEIRRVGGNKYIYTNVRIIAATNRDLAQMVKDHRFREDLYYRLNVIPIHIPPLRQRRDDIIPLAVHFMNHYNQKYQKRVTLTPALQKKLLQYSFPGNIRELRNIIERSVVTSSEWFLNQDTEPVNLPKSSVSLKIRPLKEAVREFEQGYIEQAVKASGGNVTQAAKLLNIHRTLLYKKRGQN